MDFCDCSDRTSNRLHLEGGYVSMCGSEAQLRLSFKKHPKGACESTERWGMSSPSKYEGEWQGTGASGHTLRRVGTFEYNPANNTVTLKLPCPSGFTHLPEVEESCEGDTHDPLQSKTVIKPADVAAAQVTESGMGDSKEWAQQVPEIELTGQLSTDFRSNTGNAAAGPCGVSETHQQRDLPEGTQYLDLKVTKGHLRHHVHGAEVTSVTLFWEHTDYSCAIL